MGHCVIFPNSSKPNCPCCGQPVPDIGNHVLVDLNTNRIFHHGTSVRLTPDCAAFAYALVENWPRTVSDEFIRFAIHGTECSEHAGMGSIFVYASKLRRVLEPTATIRRLNNGYRLEILGTQP